MNTKAVILLILCVAFTSFISAVEVEFIENEEFFKDSRGLMRTHDTIIPVIGGGNKGISIKINNHINSILNKFSCDPKSSLYFTSRETYQDNFLLSIRYSSLYSCVSMPNASSFDGGVTFNLLTGDTVNFSEQVKNKESLTKVSNLVTNKLNAILKSNVKKFNSCKGSRFSSNYFLSKKDVVFVEFFGWHDLDYCEVEVKVPLVDLIIFLKPDSVLISNTPAKMGTKLVEAHTNALKYYRKKDLVKAIEILHPYLGNNKYLNYDLNEKGIIGVINDFAFFLEGSGRYAESIKILKYVILKKPSRVAAYINLADSLYGDGQIKEAKSEYEKYIVLMKKYKKEKKIPKRVFSRL